VACTGTALAFNILDLWPENCKEKSYVAHTSKSVETPALELHFNQLLATFKMNMPGHYKRSSFQNKLTIAKYMGHPIVACQKVDSIIPSENWTKYLMHVGHYRLTC
jgi:hypothetical protein